MLEDHQVKKFFPQCQEKCCPRKRKSIKAGRLLEILQEQVKPTLAVFRVGGIDAVLDILIGVISAVLFVFSLSSTMTYIVTVLIATPIQFLQSANHAVVYNCDIWEKMIEKETQQSDHVTQYIITRKIMFKQKTIFVCFCTCVLYHLYVCSYHLLYIFLQYECHIHIPVVHLHNTV